MRKASDYWNESVSCALDEAGLIATKEQIESIARTIEVSADMRQECSGEMCIPNPMEEELERMKSRAKRDQAESDRRAEIYRKELAERLNIEARRLVIHNGEIDVLRQ